MLHKNLIFIWQQHPKQSQRQMTNWGKIYASHRAKGYFFNMQEDLINEYKKMNNSIIKADKEHE